jgi:hypothetical protein
MRGGDCVRVAIASNLDLAVHLLSILLILSKKGQPRSSGTITSKVSSDGA